MEIVIREITPADTPGTKIVSQEAHAFLRKFYSPSSKAKQIGADVPFTRLVAVDEQNVIATLTFEVDVDALYFGSLGVLERYRRKGIARLLVSYLEEEARQRGLSKLTCATMDATGNVEIFKRLGFEVISSEVSDSFLDSQGHPVVEVKLEKVLT